MKKILVKFFSKKAISSDSQEQIPGYIEKLQHRVASYLNYKTEKWSALKVKLLLLSFCILTGSGSIYVTVHALVQTTGPPAVKDSLQKGQMKTPLIDSVTKIDQQLKK